MKKIIVTLLALFMLTPVAGAISADAVISLQETNLSEENLTVSIQIKNPSAQAVISVQSWLKYDPAILKGKKINTDGSPFDFVAPGENTFDDQQGLVKIGRSSTGGGSTESDIIVAEVSFERLSNQATTISFYNFQVDSSGNTSVRVFADGFPVNILKTAPASFQVKEGESIPSKASLAEDKQKEEERQKQLEQELEQERQAQAAAEQERLAEIERQSRPQNLHVTSGPNYVILSWDEMPNMKGYNIYYSTTSGRYLQRRGAGDVTEYYFEGFEIDQIYYFAVTAYDFNNKETDYSNEVRIKIGYPESSSSPLVLTQSQKIIQKTKKHVDSGPAEMMLILLAITGLITIFVRKKTSP
jgi:hypothetical protein